VSVLGCDSFVALSAFTRICYWDVSTLRPAGDYEAACGANDLIGDLSSLESESPKFFSGVDLDAARSCPVGIAYSREDRLFSASIDAASGWCFRSFLVARGFADHRRRLSHFVATVKLLCLAISRPRSHVNERRREVGSLRICRLSAATTAAVSLLRTLTRSSKT